MAPAPAPGASQFTGGPAEALDPEVGHHLPCLRRRSDPAPGACFPLPLRFSQQRLDEGTTPEDPLVRPVRLAPAAEVLDRLPAADAAHQAPALQVRPPALRDARGHEGAIGRAGPAGLPREPRQDVGRCLPGAGHAAAKGGVACPGVALQLPQLANEAPAERVEMDVAHQLQQVGVLLDDDGSVPVLEEAAHPLVPAIEGSGVAGEQGSHAPGQGAGPRPHHKVGVVREQGSGVDGPGPALRQGREARDKIRPLLVIPEDDPVLDPPHHHVVQDARRIQARATRHRREAPLRSHCRRRVGLGVRGSYTNHTYRATSPMTDASPMTR